MTTAENYAGRNCPLCGAVDTLEIDSDRGEVACTECARVVAMGLEESMSTRFVEGATFNDVDDNHNSNNGGEGPLMAQADGHGGLSRSAAAALAAGLAVKSAGPVKYDMNTEAGREAKYRNTVLHANVKNVINQLTQSSRRGAGAAHSSSDNPVRLKAFNIARTFVGYRREYNIRVEGQNELASACFQIAAELNGEPVPNAELRVLNPALKNIDDMRRSVIADTRMEATEEALRRCFVPNLIQYYLRLLRLQMSKYEGPTLQLYKAIEAVTTTAAVRGGGGGGGGASSNTELVTLIQAEKVTAAVLLAHTEPAIVWDGKPLENSNSNVNGNTATACDSFASHAHLGKSRVKTVMEIVRRLLPEIKAEFTKRMQAAAAEVKTEEGGDGQPAHLSGVKRERSPN